MQHAKNCKDIQVNDRGRRIGESHPRAKLTDHEVDLLREVYEDLLVGQKKPRREVARIVADKFDVHPRTADKIYYCEKRAQTPARAKRAK